MPPGTPAEAVRRADLPHAPNASWYDRLGTGLSGLCAVHCLLMPVLLALLPFWSAATAVHHWYHPVLAVLVVPVTLVALVTGYRRHRRVSAAVLLGTGLAGVLGACVVAHLLPGTPVETVLTLVGSALLLGGHRMNAHADCAHPSAHCSS